MNTIHGCERASEGGGGTVSVTEVNSILQENVRTFLNIPQLWYIHGYSLENNIDLYDNTGRQYVIYAIVLCTMDYRLLPDFDLILWHKRLYLFLGNAH